MIIGIDASRAFLAQRTGIEEYSYQVIKHLRTAFVNDTVRLYVRKKWQFCHGRLESVLPVIDFELPEKWCVKGLWGPRFWTQGRLSLEMLLHPPEQLFVPAHTVPFIHPLRTIVTVHGLEYERSPESYSWYERLYMRFSIRYSVRVAARIIVVSENTRRDVIALYGVPMGKISLIPEGIGGKSKEKKTEKDEGSEEKVTAGIASGALRDPLISQRLAAAPSPPYFLFIGRLETRKNTVRLIEAFEIFKTKTGLPHTLVLAGKPGFGFDAIVQKIAESKWQSAIETGGYVSEREKWRLLERAEAFVFPSLYEGFGLPVLEAQSVGTPVICAHSSSLPEVAGDGALLVDPLDSDALAQAMETVATDMGVRADIIRKATHNVRRFSWAQCARSIAALLTNQ